jgi:hypothetical protein
MNRLLLALNVAAVASILATNSAALLTAISPYGNQTSPARAPAVHQTRAMAPARPAVSATPVRVTVSGFVEPTSRQDSLALATATLP